MKTVLIFGATGQVGQALLDLALQHPENSRVIALTRRALPVHAKLVNPIINFEDMPNKASWWKADFAICALGTTLRQAKSRAGFYCVGHDYVLAAVSIAKKAGTPSFALVSSLDADSKSSVFYLRTKGEIEQALAGLGFNSLIIARPSLLIGVPREHARWLEAFGLFLAKHIISVLPPRYRSVTTAKVAQALPEASLQPSSNKLRIIESEELQCVIE